MRIIALPQLMDNYAWLLVDETNGDCAVVDPADSRSVLDHVSAKGWKLRWILATHHHYDHVGGVEGISEAIADLEVLGSRHDADRRRIPRLTRALADGERIVVAGAEATCLWVPGHTLGALAYHFEGDQALFTGDTLFLGGCGRLFEGSAQQMFDSLSRLAALPEETLIYCGHEYTEKNLRFAQSLLPRDPAVKTRLEHVLALRADGAASVPAPMEVEKSTNPFLRVEDPVLQAALGLSDPVAVFTEARRRRDSF